MGNCLNTASTREMRRRRRGGMPAPEEQEALSEIRRLSQALQEEQDYDYDDAAEEEAAAAAAAEGLKVKIVLTRGELEWLMAQLKSGDHRLHDVLHHMQSVKAAAARADMNAAGGGWRPRLESILECPEIAAAT
ncbi:hypothetical protein ACP4OV_012915 [Aristida adscensionis]